MFTNYDYLAEFVVVVESSTLQEAAGKLSLSPSAVSKHLKSLEESLGCQLLIRERHAHRLTDVGETLYQASSQILNIGTEVERIANRRKPLVIYPMVDSVRMFRIIARSIARMEATDVFAGTKVIVDSDDRYSGTYAELADGTLDVIIYDSLIVPSQEPSIKHVTLMPCPYVGFVQATHPIAKRSELYIEDLKDFNLIRLTSGFRQIGYTWKVIRESCLLAGFTPNVTNHKIFMQAETALLDIGSDEVFIVQRDATCTPSLMANPDYVCLPIANMEHSLNACYLASNRLAEAIVADVAKMAN